MCTKGEHSRMKNKMQKTFLIFGTYNQIKRIKQVYDVIPLHESNLNQCLEINLLCCSGCWRRGKKYYIFLNFGPYNQKNVVFLIDYELYANHQQYV